MTQIAAMIAPMLETLSPALSSELVAPTTDAAHGAMSAAVGGGYGVGPWWAMLIPALPIVGVLLSGFYAILGVKNKLPAWTTVLCLAGAFVTAAALYAGFDSFTGGGAGFRVVAWEWFNIHAAGASGGSSFIADFGFFVDKLTVLWMLFVTGLATLIALYASEYMSHDVGPGYCRFFAAFNLFVFSMACLVMGDNLVMLYLGWEGVGLCSYLLIGYFYWKPSARDAAKKAFIVNRIGDLGLALGLYLTFVHFGTIEYAEIFQSGLLAQYHAAAMAGDFSAIPFEAQAIPLLLMVGAFGKSAQFPLYVWLPDAMEGPTPVSALIHAATMVTAGVYLIARFYPVFIVSEYALPIVAWIGTITALLAATIGMAQFDIKRIMAYSTVSQLGYMFAGLGVMTTTGAVSHVLTHAFFKALLFLSCGAVMHGFAGQLDMRKLSGLWGVKGWKIVTIAMLVGCINLAGLPFTAGFFSKDMILAEAFVTPGYQAIGWILIITAGMTAYYTFRVFFRVFMGPTHYEPGDELHDDHGDGHDDHSHAHDAGHGAGHGHAHHDFHPHAPGWAINTVLVLLSIASLAATGLFFVKTDSHGWPGSMVHDSTAYFVSPYGHHESHDEHEADEHALTTVAFQHEGEHAEPESHAAPAEAEHATPTDDAGGEAEHAGHAVVGPRGPAGSGEIFGGNPHELMYYISGAFGLAGIGLAAAFHLVGRKDAAHPPMDNVAKHFGPIPRWAENKWYVDEFYNATLRLPLLVFAHVCRYFDTLVVDGLVNLFGALPRWFGRFVRPAQSGELHGYAAGMVTGVAVLLFILAVLALRGMALSAGVGG